MAQDSHYSTARTPFRKRFAHSAFCIPHSAACGHLSSLRRLRPGAVRHQALRNRPRVSARPCRLHAGVCFISTRVVRKHRSDGQSSVRKVSCRPAKCLQQTKKRSRKGRVGQQSGHAFQASRCRHHVSVYLALSLFQQGGYKQVHIEGAGKSERDAQTATPSLALPMAIWPERLSSESQTVASSCRFMNRRSPAAS